MPNLYDCDLPRDSLFSGSGGGYVHSKGAVIAGLIIAQGSAVGTVTILTSAGGTIRGRYTVPARTQGQGTIPITFPKPIPIRPKFRLNRAAGGTGAGINARMKIHVFYWLVRDRAATV